MDKCCNQCDGEILANEETVVCRVCKTFVHVACARAATALIATRSTKKIDKFVCRICIAKGSDTASQGSETSEIIGEDNVKSILLKMNKKLQGLDEIKETCNFLSAKYDEFIKQQKDQAQLIKDLTKKVEHLNGELIARDKVISDLTDRISELEQSQYSQNLEICGIPVVNNENVYNIVKNVADACHITMDGVQEIYRQKARRQNQIPSILVKFATTGRREIWLKRKEGRRLTVDDALENGSEAKVYINEQLTRVNRRLLWLSRQRGKERNYKYIWCKNGRIYARKDDELAVVVIKNEGDVLRKIV
jgi:glutaredoxin 2